MSPGQEISAAEQEPTVYLVMIERRNAWLQAGTVYKAVDGWRFIPAYQSSPSRRGWPTPDAALKGRLSNYKLARIGARP